MKARNYIQQLMLLLLPVGLLTACLSEEEGDYSPNEGKVPVTVQLGGQYAVMSGKDAPDSNTRSTNNSALNGVKILNLTEGSTLWLFAKTGRGTQSQGYVVKTGDGGVQSLYPCSKFDENGNYKEENVSKTPLFLAPGKYTFSAISPAKAAYQDGKCTIKNGEYVIATNDKWTQTESTTYDISGNEGVILLNPLMQVTSRMKFLIKGTSKISNLSIMQAGVEIDGIQADPTGDNYTVGDNMASKLGDKYNRLYVPANSFITTPEGVLQGETGILPTDCRSTPVVVIMNVLVNDVPTQFTYSIVGKQFLPGYSYNYTVTLDIKDGITVANWQESSWSADIDPD